jgi:hypothetical protein
MTMTGNVPARAERYKVVLCTPEGLSMKGRFGDPRRARRRCRAVAKLEGFLACVVDTTIKDPDASVIYSSGDRK